MKPIRRLSSWIWDRIDIALAHVAALLPEKARWFIAERANRHLPRQCWSDLVMWAMRDPKDDPDWRCDLPWRPIGEICRKGAQDCGRCYCGKLAADGSVLRAGETVPTAGGAS